MKHGYEGSKEMLMYDAKRHYKGKKAKTIFTVLHSM